MRSVILTLSFLFLTAPLYGQDERFFREIFSGSLIPNETGRVKEIDLSSWKAATKTYRFDFNDDGNYEGVKVVKKDGKDFLDIYNHRGDKFYSVEFTPKGKMAKLYRISIHKVSKKTKVFFLHYYEGYNEYFEFRSTSRLYMLTMDNNKLKTFHLFF